MDLQNFTCSLDGCDGPRSGVCINSLPFDECPDVIPASPDGEELDTADIRERSSEMVETPGARSLDASTCDELLRQRGGILIGIVAGPEVGKTTLIGTLYELIHRRRMPGFGFAGSETLRGYEERTFLSRIASSRPAPDTPRTKVKEELSFTHLRVKTEFGIRDVFFSDRSGEQFDMALNKTNLFSGFTELLRANAILLMVDLEQLLVHPQPLISSVRRFFMAMQQYGLTAHKPVTLVGTKADLLVSDDDRREVENRFQHLLQDLCNRCETETPPNGTIVSSRASRGSNKVGEGLNKLLDDLIPRPEVSSFSFGNATPQQHSELSSLMVALREKGK